MRKAKSNENGTGPDPGGRRHGVLYARVSSKEQEREGFSIPAQRKLLHEYAGAHGVTLDHEYTDIETAGTSGRTAFGEMLKYLRAHPECRIVLVEKTDRLYRNFRDWVDVDELGLELHLVKENAIISAESRSSEKLAHGIHVLMAKNYIDNLSEEVKKGMTAKAETGMWPSFAPLGYRNVPGPNGKRAIELDPATSPVVRQLFENYATGICSLKEPGQVAREAGLVARGGGRLFPGALQKVLRNLTYTGDFLWKGTRYHGTYKPVVSHELWKRVQDALDYRLGKRKKKGRHGFPFSGLLSCGHCGCALVGEIKKGRYIYYHCTGHRGKCPEPYTRQEVFEDAFGDVLKRLRIDGEVAEWVTDALRTSHVDEQRFHEEAVNRLQDRYNRLQKRLDAMYDDKLDGRIDAHLR